MAEDWYSTGFSKTDQAQKEQSARKSNEIRRFYLKAGQSKDLVFIDDIGFEIWEHNLKINGKWGNFFTCIGSQNGCPFCLAKKPRNYVNFFTVLDLSGYVNKKGETQGKNQIQLFPARPDVAVIIRREKEIRPGKTLVGASYSLFRTSDKDVGTGSQFSFIKHYDPAYVKGKYKPVDYREVLKPMSVEESRNLLASLEYNNYGPQGQPNNMPSMEEQGGGSSSFNSDDIPF